MSRHILYYGWIAGYLKRNPGGASSSVAYTTTEIPEVGGQLYACDLSFSYNITTVYIDGDSIACDYDAIGEIEITGLTRSPENDIYEEEAEYLVREINVSAFRGNPKITTVDCNEIPWTDDNMSGAFQSCVNLTSITNISKTVINMSSTFKSCTSLVEAPVIPNSVVNAASIYYGCEKLVGTPVIPNSVVDLSHGFSYCASITEVTSLPNSITNLAYAYSYCTNLQSCKNIVDGAINLDSMFKGCTNLVSNNITIPYSVTNIANMFNGCINVTGDIYIYSNQITDVTDFFKNASNNINVYIPFIYYKDSPYTSVINETNTVTYNTFIAAGYDNMGTKDGVRLKNILNLYTVSYDADKYYGSSTGYTSYGNYSGSPYHYTTEAGNIYRGSHTTVLIRDKNLTSSGGIINLASDITVVKN